MSHRESHLHGESELTILGRGETKTVPLARQFILGSRLDADLVLESPGVAPTHLVINPSPRGAMLVVIDQGRQVPVLVQGEQVLTPRRLQSGDTISVDNVRLVYQGELAQTEQKGAGTYWQSSASEAPDTSRSVPFETQTFSWFKSQPPSLEGQSLRMLYRFAKLANVAVSENALLEQTLELVLEEVPASEQGLIARLDDEHGVVPVLVARPHPGGTPFELVHLRAALEQGLLITTDDRPPPAIYAPVVGAGGLPLSVLCLRRAAGSPSFSEEESQVVALVGRQLGVALERVRLLKQLQAGGLAHSRLQRRFEASLGAIGEGLVLLFADGTVEPLNPHGEELLRLITAQGARAPLDPLLEQLARGTERVAADIRAGECIVRASLSPVESLDGVVVALRDVTETRRQEEVNRRAQEELRGELLRISGREQRRIGHTLHDGLCQQLVGISLLARGLEEQARSSKMAVIATEIVNLLSKAAEDTRRLAKGLCPVALETSGLGSALKELARSSQHLFPNLRCRATSEGEVLGPRNPIATHLYHIAQEAVSNAAKHGKAEQVEIALRREDGTILLRVENDGLPFTPPADDAEGMGLRIMRYRAQMLGAALSIHAGERAGTRVECRLAADGLAEA